MGIFGRSLPEERCQVVVIRTFPSALIVDEVGIALAVEHHVARLEVTVEETLHVRHGVVKICGQVLGKEAEVGLQLQLMEVDLRGLQETVFEIIEVEEHTVHIKLCLGIAVGEVEPAGTAHLDVRQFTDSSPQQLLFLQRVTPTGLTTAAHGIEERHRTQVGLQVAQLIVTGSQYLWHGQLTTVEMLCQIEESMVFVTAGADHADHRLPLLVGQSVIGTVTARPRQLMDMGRLCPLRVLSAAAYIIYT